jgi:hypothetical protein
MAVRSHRLSRRRQGEAVGPLCVMVTVGPAAVSVPVRDDVDVFAVTV